jgi:hypothetical protein
MKYSCVLIVSMLLSAAIVRAELNLSAVCARSMHGPSHPSSEPLRVRRSPDR